MKRAWVIVTVVLLVALSAVYFGRSGFSTYDYDYKCTKCLRDYHEVEYKFFGHTYRKTEHLEFAGNDWTSIFGAPCEHVYRTGTYGQESGGMKADGITAEGTLFGHRWDTLNTAFVLYQKFPNKDLMKRTIQVADTILPPDATVDYMKDPKMNKMGLLIVFNQDLGAAKSEQDWDAALKKVELELIKSRVWWNAIEKSGSGR